MTRRPRPARRALTLPEALVALAAVGVAAGLLLSAVQKAREAAARARSGHNLGQLARGLHACQDAGGWLPPAVGFWPGRPDWDGWDGPPPVRLAPAWVFVLPHVGEEAVWRRFGRANSAAGLDDPGRDTPAVLRSPADDSLPPGGRYPGWPLPLCSYAANAALLGCNGFRPGDETFAPDQRATLAAIPDGASNTVLASERYARPGWGANSYLYVWDVYYAPVLGQHDWSVALAPQSRVPYHAADPFRANGMHPGGVLVALADGSVRFVGEHVGPDTWRRAQLPADGALLGPDW